MNSPRNSLPLALGLLAASSALAAPDMLVYFGSHSSAPDAGFSLGTFDSKSGALSTPTFLLHDKEPAYFVLTPDGTHLYTCNSGKPGGVTSYRVEAGTGKLTLLNTVAAGGGDPSYITLDQTGRFILIANYDGGNIAAFRLAKDGSIGERTAFAQHTGSSVHPQRQTHAYAHAIVLDPTNRFALVPDLGLDRLFVYRFDAELGTLTPNEPAFVTIAPGSGPRHVRFHSSGRWVYLINEMGSRIDAFTWDTKTAALQPFQSITTLPADFTGTSTCAELDFHPNGKFLYGSNRGHDSIAVFAIDQATGRLTPVETVSSGGKTPRNFTFDPTGRWMLVTNHSSNNAVVFGVDAATGRLTRTGEPVKVPSAFCERFLPLR